MYQTAVAVHIVSAVVWLGGMLFLVMVMIPVARQAMRSEGTGAGLAMLRDAGERFLPVAWTAMVLLGLSGGYLAWQHWGIRPGVFFTDDGRFMHILQAKSLLFLIVVVLSLVHDFWLGPKVLERLDQARAAGQALPQSLGRKIVRMTAGVNLLAAMTILVLAVWLIRP
ncbi:MAG: CopD family protein [Chloroflexi bacterium]|nr:CopD family protein [Chloroflexota bacterium]